MEMQFDTFSGLTSTVTAQQLSMPQVPLSTNQSTNFMHPAIPCGYCDCHLNGCKFTLWFVPNFHSFSLQPCFLFQICQAMKKANVHFNHFRLKQKNNNKFKYFLVYLCLYIKTHQFFTSIILFFYLCYNFIL